MTVCASPSVVEFKEQFATNWLCVPRIEIQVKKVYSIKRKNPPETRLKKRDTVIGTSVSLYNERKLIQ